MGLYEDVALKEYETEGVDEYRLVYSYFGLAIYHCQVIEMSLSMTLIFHKICKSRIKSSSDVKAIFDKIDNAKKTLGCLIHEVKQCHCFTTEFEDSIKGILDERNYLAHNYFKELDYSNINTESRKKDIKYFCDFIDKCSAIDDALMVYHKQYLVEMGISEDLIAEELKKQIMK